MVWGLATPKGFGDYSPRGSFEGWEEQLRDYFWQQPPEWQAHEGIDAKGYGRAEARVFC